MTRGAWVRPSQQQRLSVFEVSGGEEFWRAAAGRGVETREAVLIGRGDAAIRGGVYRLVRLTADERDPLRQREFQRVRDWFYRFVGGDRGGQSFVLRAVEVLDNAQQREQFARECERVAERVV